MELSLGLSIPAVALRGGEGGGGGLPPLPDGTFYLVDESDGAYLVDESDGAYLIWTEGGP